MKCQPRQDADSMAGSTMTIKQLSLCGCSGLFFAWCSWSNQFPSVILPLFIVFSLNPHVCPRAWTLLRFTRPESSPRYLDNDIVITQMNLAHGVSVSINFYSRETELWGKRVWDRKPWTNSTLKESITTTLQIDIQGAEPSTPACLPTHAPGAWPPNIITFQAWAWAAT